MKKSCIAQTYILVLHKYNSLNLSPVNFPSKAIGKKKNLRNVVKCSL